MTERGIPKNARRLQELLAQDEHWRQEAIQLFRDVRVSSGMTQSAFAASINTSQSYVNDIEHGRKTPSAGTLAKLRSLTEGESHGDQDQGQAQEDGD